MSITFQKITSFFSGKYRDFFIWIIFFLLLFIGGIRFDPIFSLLTSMLIMGGMMLIYYINKSILCRYLLERGKYILYTLTSFVLVCGLIILSVGIDDKILDYYQELFHPYKKDLIYPIFRFTLMYLIAFAVSAINHSAQKTSEVRKQNQHLLLEKQEMELRFLKAQINPHFLFNALNNIYSLTYIKDDKAPDCILRLSDMLRYVTDDCQAELVPIEKEIAYTDNYIEFQQLRFEGPRNIVFTKDIHNTELRIPPVLLQPFVENCFKYSRLESNPDGYIRLNLSTDKEGLCFTTENSIAKGYINTSKQSSGIGISNVRQRLNITFGDNYSLHIIQKPDSFRTELYIKIRKIDDNKNQK